MSHPLKKCSHCQSENLKEIESKPWDVECDFAAIGDKFPTFECKGCGNITIFIITKPAPKIREITGTDVII